MIRAACIMSVSALFAGSVVQAADFAVADPRAGTWSLLFSELVRSIDIGIFAVLVILVVTVGLAIDAFYHIRISKLIPEDLLAAIQEEMANGEYEKALEACLKSDCLAGQVFAAALSKTDHSFERMEGAMKGEAQILGLIWRQWLGQFKLMAMLALMVGLLAALFNAFRLIADLPGRPNLGLAFASSFEMRSFLYCIAGSLFIGILSATISFVVHYFCRAKLERILLEADRLGEELLDPFRPLPQSLDDEI